MNNELTPQELFIKLKSGKRLSNKEMKVLFGSMGGYVPNVEKQKMQSGGQIIDQNDIIKAQKGIDFNNLVHKYQTQGWDALSPTEQDQYRMQYSTVVRPSGNNQFDAMEIMKPAVSTAKRLPYGTAMRKSVGRGMGDVLNATEFGLNAVGETLSTPFAMGYNSIKNHGPMGLMAPVMAYNTYNNASEILPNYNKIAANINKNKTLGRQLPFGPQSEEAINKAMSAPNQTTAADALRIDAKKNPYLHTGVNLATGFLEPGVVLAKAPRLAGKASKLLKGTKAAKMEPKAMMPIPSIISELGNKFNDFSSFVNQVGGLPFERFQKGQLAEANRWLKNWISDPTTRNKIYQDLGQGPDGDIRKRKGLSDDIPSPTREQVALNFRNNSQTPTTNRSDNSEYLNLKNLPPTDNMFRQSREKDMEFLSNFTPNSRFYPMKEHIKDFFTGKPALHRDNVGISYQHVYDPKEKVMIEEGRHPLVNGLRQTGSWISRNPLYNLFPKGRQSVAVHEGTHDWADAMSLIESGQAKFIQDVIGDDAPRLASKRHDAYYKDPTEVHARIMELRYLNNLKPGQKVTEDMARDIIKKTNKSLNPMYNGKKAMLKILGNDPKKLSKLMNRLWAVTPLAVATGAAAASQQRQDGGNIHQNDIIKAQKGIDFDNLINKYQSQGWQSLTPEEQDAYRSKYSTLVRPSGENQFDAMEIIQPADVVGKRVPYGTAMRQMTGNAIQTTADKIAKGTGYGLEAMSAPFTMAYNSMEKTAEQTGSPYLGSVLGINPYSMAYNTFNTLSDEKERYKILPKYDRQAGDVQQSTLSSGVGVDRNKSPYLATGLDVVGGFLEPSLGLGAVAKVPKALNRVGTALGSKAIKSIMDVNNFPKKYGTGHVDLNPSWNPYNISDAKSGINATKKPVSQGNILPATDNTGIDLDDFFMQKLPKHFNSSTGVKSTVKPTKLFQQKQKEQNSINSIINKFTKSPKGKASKANIDELIDNKEFRKYFIEGTDFDVIKQRAGEILKNSNKKGLTNKYLAYLVTRDPEVLKYTTAGNPNVKLNNKIKDLSDFRLKELNNNKAGFGDITNPKHANKTIEEFIAYKESLRLNDPGAPLKTSITPRQINQLLPEEIMVMNRYTKGYDGVMNSLKRFNNVKPSNKTFSKAINSDIGTLTKGITRNKFPEDTKLFRGVSPYKGKVITSAGKKVKKLIPDELEEGDIFTEKGFLSTSTSPFGAFGNNRMVINAPGGKQSHVHPNWYPSDSQYPLELESILPPGLKLQKTKDGSFNILNPYMQAGLVPLAGAAVASQQQRQYGGNIDQNDIIKAQKGVDLLEPYTPNLDEAKQYLKNTYQSNAYKQRLQNELEQSINMPNNYRYSNPKTLNKLLLEDRLQNLNDTRVLPSISLDEDDPTASGLLSNKENFNVIGALYPNFGGTRLGKHQDKDLYYISKKDPYIAVNPLHYGLKYDKDNNGLQSTGVEEYEHASHLAVPFSGVNVPDLSNDKTAYLEMFNITPYARSVIKENATDHEYFSKPTEAIAAKRRVEHMFSKAPKGTFKQPFKYGQKMTDEHFNYIIEQAKKGDSNSIRMVQTLMGPDAENLIKSLSPENKIKYQKNFKNIMDKIAINNNSNNLHYAKLGGNMYNQRLIRQRGGSAQSYADAYADFHYNTRTHVPGPKYHGSFWRHADDAKTFAIQGHNSRFNLVDRPNANVGLNANMILNPYNTDQMVSGVVPGIDARYEKGNMEFNAKANFPNATMQGAKPEFKLGMKRRFRGGGLLSNPISMQKGGDVVSENDKFWSQFEEKDDYDIKSLPRPNVMTGEEMLSQLDEFSPEYLKLERELRIKEKAKNTPLGPPSLSDLDKQIENQISGKIGAIPKSAMGLIAKDNPIGMSEYLKRMSKEDPKAFNNFYSTYSDVTNEYNVNPEMEAKQKALDNYFTVHGIKKGLNKATSPFNMPRAQKGGNLPCMKCGGAHKPGVMCHGGHMGLGAHDNASFEVIDESDILHPSDTRRFATRENNNPVGFKFTKTISKQY